MHCSLTYLHIPIYLIWVPTYKRNFSSRQGPFLRDSFETERISSAIAVVSLIKGANQYVATRVFRLDPDVFGLSKQPSMITNVDDFASRSRRRAPL